MAIKLYVGIQGSGKTYEVVTVVIMDALREGRRVVTNIAGLNIDEINSILLEEGLHLSEIGSILSVTHDQVESDFFFRTDTDHLKHIETTIQPGDVLILDEIWRFWEGRSSVTPRQQNFFRMHRQMVHPTLCFTCEIVLITQDVADVCSKIRNVVEKTFVMTKHTALGSDTRYRVDIYARANVSARVEPINSYQRSYNPELFCLYKSHSTNAADVQAKEVSIDKRGNLWQRPIIKFGVPFSVLMLGTCIYLMFGFFHPKNKSAPSFAASAAVSGSSSVVSASSVPVQSGLILSTVWRVQGWYFLEKDFIVVLSGSDGVLRYLHNPPSFQFQARDLAVKLPEGGFVTTFSGSHDISHGLLK